MTKKQTFSVDKNSQIKNKYRSFLGVLRKYFSEDEQKKVRKVLRSLIAYGGNEISPHTGELLVVHAMNVARTVITQIGLGTVSAVAALCHELRPEDLVSGEILKDHKQPCMMLLEGMDKISGIRTKGGMDESENFRRLILNLAGDVRVVLIILADKLEMMRSLDFNSPDDQLKMATEAYYLYAPLAHRLGLYNIKSAMEDLSLKYLEPAVYKDLQKKIADTRSVRNRYIHHFIAPLKEKLDQEKFRYEIKSRLKSIHSIWEKMQVQGVPFKEVYDLFAVRIIVDSPPGKEKEVCWHVYSIVTDIYTPNPSRLRDWISIPKSNGYESLHTTVVGQGGRWVEVQIRTTRMDEIAEQGYAAHWKYKGGRGDNNMDRWLQNVREILESEESTEDIINEVKLNLYSNEIFVFTPKGDVIRLPEHATLLDFAFAIHSDVGLKCTGGKVNDKAVPIDHLLTTGDRAEVHTTKNQKPSTDWLTFVVTSKAKSKIRQSLDEEKTRAAREGREILMRRVRNWKIPFDDHSQQKLLQHFRIKAVKDFFALVFEEKIDLLEVKEVLTRKEDTSDKEEKSGAKKIFSLAAYAKNEDFLVIDQKVKNVEYTLARCCNPIFGDPVFGFVSIREGIKIHRQDCPNAKAMKSRYPYRIVPAKWNDASSGNLSFEAVIKVMGQDDVGIVNRITELISTDLRINMRSIQFNTVKGNYEGVIKLFVTNADHLEVIIRKIERLKGVHKVSRFYDMG